MSSAIFPRTVSLEVEVRPGSGRDEIKGVVKGHRLQVHLKAQAQNGEANEALLRFLSKIWRIPRASLRLGKGARSKHKTIWVGLASAEEAERVESHLALSSPWAPLLFA